MRYLLEIEEELEAIRYFLIATDIAKKSSCLRVRCGSIIVKDNKIIGEGFNSPPGNLESQRRCLISKDTLDKKVTDKTCCIHAEQRAIFNALKNNPEKLNGSRLYFIRLNKEGNMEMAGKPYCTICSKSALDVRIKEFVLFEEKGICVYATEEYNKLSFEYKNKQ